MCSMLYYKNPNSPYQDLYTSPSLEELSSAFSAQFCFFMGLSPDSPVYLAVTAGTMALPVLSKLSTLMKKQRAEWSTSDELPTEVALPESFVYHSIFVCPVSKEQTTEYNPPKVLPCGHILADDSLRALPKRKGSLTFKCPYCPSVATYKQAIRVYF